MTVILVYISQMFPYFNLPDTFMDSRIIMDNLIQYLMKNKKHVNNFKLILIIRPCLAMFWSAYSYAWPCCAQLKAMFGYVGSALGNVWLCCC